MNETYLYGQGRVSLAKIDPITLVAGAFVWVGDVSALSLKLSSDKVQHKESYSGQRGLVRSFPVGAALEVDMTFNDFGADNLARLLRSAKQSIVTGTVTAETVGSADTAVGDELFLANPGVTDLVLTDSNASPVTLVEGTDYTLDANFGRITILNIGTFTLPFKADYSYSARTEVGMFTQGQQLYALKYQGLNLAEGNAPILVDIFKLAPDILQQLDLVTTGTDTAGMQVTGGALIDTSKPATGALGQFGSITQLAAVA